jgi:hypothetical protein
MAASLNMLDDVLPLGSIASVGDVRVVIDPDVR